MQQHSTVHQDSDQHTVVQITDLHKHYGTTHALRGVDLTIKRGEIVVLLGLSGSGKSTLLRHLDGLDLPTSGQVEVLGQDVSSLRGKQMRKLRQRVGFIFQQFELVAPLTVLENVLTGSLATLRGPRLGLTTYPRALRERAWELLDEVGLGDKAFERADQLSGGQQQRVAIARALMQDPEILLADEPVASLDPESSNQVMNLIREIGMRRQLTVVCSLHQVDLALSWADRIVGLRHGETVLDTQTEGLSKQNVMEIYGSVTTNTSDLTAVTRELSEELAELTLAGTETSR